MKPSQKRIQALEEKAGIGALVGPAVFLMWFASEITSARSGGATWAREPGETIGEFQERLSRDVPQTDSYYYRMIRYLGEPGDGTFSEQEIL